MNVFEKYMGVQENKILEENLCFSNDGSEVLFKCFQKGLFEWSPIYLSLDLVNSQLRLFKGKF